ncbi:response regulator receiver domain [Bosea sp. R86505]|uniref:response regulator receiver domain n=1 Tax=Bosea sp. R86505 TaxID=3101710 RepID=UPI0036734C17
MNVIQADLSLRGVMSFVQTVLVIDNELTFEDEPVAGGRLNAPKVAFGRKAAAAPVNVGGAADAEDEVEPSPLDAKAIMDAFLKESMICGMHKPLKGDDLVAEAIKAARRSDAVIVDWRLDGADTAAAKAIVAGILEGDEQERGRLRLIAIYTSEPDIASVASQLSDHLGREDVLKLDGHALTGQDTRIIVLNKDGTVGGRDVVRVGELPGRIVKEFSELAGGILSTFAVTAIAAVRRSTHHVLSVFSRSLDGSYVAHRSAIKSPEDAQDFALDLLTGELRSVVSMNPDAMEVLKVAHVADWIGKRAKDGLITGGGIEIPVEVVKGFPERGEFAVIESQPIQRKPGDKVNQVKGKNCIQPHNVALLFHDDAESADEHARRFARLSSFKSEAFGRTKLPIGWSPILTLGTLMVQLSARGHVLPGRYLLCTQPRCDAVRIKEAKRGFPFQLGSEATERPFHLVVMVKKKGEVKQANVKIGNKPYDTQIIEFVPNADQRVQAVVGASGHFEFVDRKRNRYLWLGELRDLTAQRVASSVAARLHEVGIDEFEWLRLQGHKA